MAFGRYFAGRPNVNVEGHLPSRLTAGRTVSTSLEVLSRDGRATGYGVALVADIVRRLRDEDLAR